MQESKSCALPLGDTPLYGRLALNYKFEKINSLGASKGIRTPDPRLRRAMLYPAELLTHIGYRLHFSVDDKNLLNSAKVYLINNGAGEGNRTLVTSLEG